jgi:hypothetical protein
MDYFEKISESQLTDIFNEYYSFFESIHLDEWLRKPTGALKLDDKLRSSINDIGLFFTQKEKDLFLNKLKTIGCIPTMFVWLGRDAINLYETTSDSFMLRPVLMTAAIESPKLRIMKDHNSWYYVDAIMLNEVYKCDDLQGLIKCIQFLK